MNTTTSHYLKKALRKRLIDALHNKDDILAKKLLRQGATIEDDNLESLWFACQRNWMVVVKYYAETGIDLNAENGQAIYNSLMYKNFEIMKYLIDKGAKVDCRGGILLIKSCLEGYTEIVKILVDKGMDIHLDNDNPIKRAIAGDNLGLVKFLINEYSVDLSTIDLETMNNDTVDWVIKHKELKKLNENLNSDLQEKSEQTTKLKI